MFLLNNFDINIASWIILGGSTIFMVASIFKNIYIQQLPTTSSSTQTDILQNLSSDSNQSPIVYGFTRGEFNQIKRSVSELSELTSNASDLTITPGMFTQEQLSQMEVGIQTSPINNFMDKAVQTISNNSNSIGIQTNPPLIVDTTNLSPGFEKWITYSHSEKSVQTLFNRLEQGIQTIPNPDLVIKGDIPPIGILHDPIFMEGMINSYYYVDGYINGSEMLVNYAQLLM